MNSIVLGLVALSAMTPSPTGQSAKAAENLLEKFLSAGASLAAPGALPGPVVAFDRNAVVVAAAKDGGASYAAVAVSKFGQGRALVAGHGALLSNPANVSIVTTLHQWLAPEGGPKPKVTSWNTLGRDASKLLPGNPNRPLILEIPMDPCPEQQECIAPIVEYVRTGGALIAAGPAWGWKQLNPGKSLNNDMGAQRILSQLGLGLADGFLDMNDGKLALLTPTANHHAFQALQALEPNASLSAAEASIAGAAIDAAYSAAPTESRYFQTANDLIKSVTPQVPTIQKPIRTENVRQRLAARKFDSDWRALSPEQVRAHPAARDFPGEVSGSERKSLKVNLGGGKRRWWSTGAYAAPGEVIVLESADELAKAGAKVRIGGHKDELWHLDKWERFPSITHEVPISAGQTRIATPFGGLVYIVSGQTLPKVNLTLRNVIEAPVYMAGKTKDQDWQRLRNSAAPWGEIVGANCAISIPASVLKNVANPAEVARYWDEVVTVCAEFYAEDPQQHEERYQADRQISAGYMHAGYPIMTWLDVQEKFVDLSILRGPQGGPNWGFYHEVGHNFQRDPWTLSEWGETTNNLYSLFACEHFNKDLGKGHGAMNDAERAKRIATVKSAPGKERYYAKDPWYGLTFWTELQARYGWKPITEIFAEYRALASNAAPRGEQQKRDQLLVRLSKRFGVNLSDYFRAWGVSVSETATRQIQSMPKFDW